MFRSLAVLCAIAASPLAFVGAKAAPSACGGFWTPVLVIVCNDVDLQVLDDELQALFSKAVGEKIGNERIAFVGDQTSWQKNRQAKCQVPAVPLAVSALHSRACLVNLYKERIKKIGGHSSVPSERLVERPRNVEAQHSFFVIALSRSTLAAVESEFAQLTSEFPFESFALYPPFADRKQWTIVLASYLNHAQAVETRNLATALGIATEPIVWQPPNLSLTDEWTPLLVHHASSNTTAKPAAQNKPSKVSEARSAASAKVIACYNAGVVGGKSITIQQMFDCSGVWVTHRALLRCAVQAQCPILFDSIEDRAILDSTLKAEGLTRDSILSLNQNDLPPMPGANEISRCKNASSSDDAFVNCVAPTITDPRYALLQTCLGRSDEAQRLACFASQIHDYSKALLGCSIDGPVTPDTVLACDRNPSVKGGSRQYPELCWCRDEHRRCTTMHNQST